MFTREHLIQYLVDNIADRILQNAVCRGKVESYGWFDPLPYADSPGFIVSVTSCWKKTYIIGVGFKEVTGDPYWFRIKDVPWSNWKGGGDRLHRGDNPETYRRMKNDT